MPHQKAAPEPLKYEVTLATGQQQAQVAAWGWSRGGDGWITRGPCPRCHHTVTKSLGYVTALLPRAFGLPGERLMAESSATPSGKVLLMPSLPKKVKLFCNCDVEHAPGKQGCGFWVQDIPGPSGGAHADE